MQPARRPLYSIDIKEMRRLNVYRVEEVERRHQEEEVGSQSASSFHPTPGVAVGAEVSSHTLPEQCGRRRTVDRP